MRRIASKVVIDIATNQIVEHDYQPYFGVIAELKKGREQQAQVTNAQLQQMQHDSAVREAQLNKAEPFLTGLESSKPGELSPYASAQYGADENNIAKTYGDVRRAGLRAIGTRGFGNAPTGMLASVINTANNNQGADETNAYENALRQTYGEGLEAMKARMGLISTYDPTKPAEVASNSAYRQSQMGSTLGDIGQGLSAGAGLALTGAKIASGV